MLAKQLLKPASVFSIFFVVCISLIHTLPYNAAELRTLLTPANECPMPCFMGIRPGVTTYDEALAIMEEHPWVQHIKASPGESINIVQWTGQQPDFIDTKTPASLRFSQSGKVYDIDVRTTLRVGDIRLLLGQPSTLRLTVLREPTSKIYITNIYDRYSLGLITLSTCPLGHERFLISPARIVFGTAILHTTGSPVSERRSDGLQASWCR